MAKLNFSQWKGADRKLLIKANEAVDNALDEQAELLTKKAQRQVPKDSHALKRSAKTDKQGSLTTNKKRRVSFAGPYAAYQHEGKRKDGTHVVRNYTTAGTKKLYLKDPLEKNTGKWASIVVKNFKAKGF